MSRKRRRRKVGKHISLSATDADWETVRSNAKRRGLSIARYLVELVERDASEEDAGPALALAAEEQRELLEAVREVRALMLEGEDAGPLVRDMQERIAVSDMQERIAVSDMQERIAVSDMQERIAVSDMQERIAVMFAAWASAMAGSGRSEELLRALASVLGEERARIAAASVMASVAPSAAKRAKVAPAGDGKTHPRQDRRL